MLQNQYTLLKKANDLSAETLNTENRLVLKNISQYLLCMTWNCYEIERIRKDLIDIAARCELEGRTLQEEVGGDIERFLVELAPDLPRGTPLDYVCIWYPKWILIFAAMYLLAALGAGNQEPNLFRVVIGPFQFMFWLLIYSWFHRMVLKIKVRYGSIAQGLWYLLLILFCILFCFVAPVQILDKIPGRISFLGAFFYELAWAVFCQLWQNIHYNRCAARHPWQEQPREA